MAVHLRNLRSAQIIELHDDRAIFSQGKIPMVYFHQRKGKAATAAYLNDFLPPRQLKTFKGNA